MGLSSTFSPPYSNKLSASPHHSHYKNMFYLHFTDATYSHSLELRPEGFLERK